ncbi:MULTISPECIES: histidine--tRNA ligase [unclassified Campylobacter]|uniref:histidine--tRNA ligase n=1 Tax=unclassified Campylobacter TaxID=2593542 RepID=UPI0022E9D6DF|nr:MULTISPECIES: histidine--tRNA ligase [unclassified Campylobacter]MDA3056824.1 histidine--tRNA ligase [Campylobacter sp. CN_NA1]MDA3065984.1 histidine--tRNA ligase [Campylobacter sp. CN_NE4]MDA3069344.1 histidine--tRNA ligase [Campylobacter sp. CN_NE3]MDA3083310.1 histidine--tRNA ligase [Campylobacter sp. CN_EL2]MDA3084850.1 histidine--tRNA ligase [Campylobacter sp. CN_NE1]
MIKALRGMNDLFDEKAKLYTKIVQICEQVAKNYGYEFIETPKLEETALFKRSVGESSDIVGKEMYEFSDKGGTSVCLRPEGTAGVVRAFIENKFDRAGGVRKYYYFGSMFRYERPQKGRLREFHQFGVECFGQGSVYEDASVILMLNEILNRLEIRTTLKINSLGDSECMPKYKEKLVRFLDANKANLCEDCLRRIATNPIRVLDCKNENCQKVLQNAPLITKNLNETCQKDFEKLQVILRENGVKFEVDAKLVRGLDYYCKTAFEFISDEIGSQSAVGGGGRYDRLVEFLGGRPTFGVGFAIGIERLMEILSLKEAKKERDGVYICAMDEKYIDRVFALGQELRKFIKTEISYEAKNLAKHLKNADAKEAEIFLCMGENEAQKGELWYKNLVTKQEKMVKLSNIKTEIENA